MPRLALFAAAALTAAPLHAQDLFDYGTRNTEFAPAFEAQFRAPQVASGVTLETTTVAGGLEHPWGVAVLPEGGYLVTERPGRMRHVGADGTLSDPIAGIPDVVAMQQGGLLDVALAPDFETSRMIYWTYAKPVGNATATAAARGTLSEDYARVSGVEDIWVQEPAVPVPAHFGSRILFDGAGHVFITTGEHFTVEYRQYAQEMDKTFGKVIRLHPDGTVPDDNPFAGDETAAAGIWSLGHRNIQGATFMEGDLWTVEHGPKGGDELNLTEAGKNYGWPVVSYGVNYSGTEVGSGEADHAARGFDEPDYFWDPVIAPSGMTVYDGGMFEAWQGDLLIGSLSPGALVRLSVENGRVTEEERFLPDIGRVRDVVVDDDGSVLILIDADDGELVRLTPAG
ncbi:PQQ-dependent sugar dehydrogenase [Psychromarinibacter sp. C21-152]|uniref:PQQ-dependent sugar dehydrogenase n=1 Tax=Psychromarinibacter sediminicola TaxID=3033385 RepID=A0AAE3TA98_9RHOB|nr:PQQ-dependent sugar dehydrogenase [Psychromarinibacter sediminicola]MDF0602633.1 PQQ-dependent sugar dehydrogenase [Psychromarinibacter sediminicola]